MQRAIQHRNASGVTDYVFDKIDEVEQRNDLEFEKKIKIIDILLKQIWSGAKTNMEFKKLTLRAPDIAKSADVILDLGSANRQVPTKQEPAQLS